MPILPFTLPAPWWTEQTLPAPPLSPNQGSTLPEPDPRQIIGTSTQPRFTVPYIDKDVRPDISLGGWPMWLATSNDFPYLRHAVQYRKQQVDLSAEPGEQSLNTWWYRSQSSFHGGAGQNRMDGAENNSQGNMSDVRFSASVGVRVFDKGKMTLAPDTTQVLTSANSGILLCPSQNAGADVVLIADGANLKRLNPDNTLTTLTWGGTGTILSITSDGQNYYAANATSIFKGPVDASGSGVALYSTGSSKVVVRWVKNRLVAAVGLSVYELNANSGTTTLPTANCTATQSGWTWTDFCAGPSGIYGCGYVGSYSAVFKFLLDTSGGTPILLPGAVTIELPLGEVANSIACSMLSNFAVGTSKGVRICGLSGYQGQGTDLLLGPLSIIAENPIKSVYGYGKFFIVGHRDIDSLASGTWRIDLSTPIPDPSTLTYAAVSDLRANTATNGTDLTPAKATVSSVCQMGRLSVFSLDGFGVFVEHATRLVPAGYLITSQISYRTLDRKVWKRLTTFASGSGLVLGRMSLDGAVPVQASAHDPSLSPTLDGAINGVGIWASLTLTLVRNTTDVTLGPTLSGYTLKGLPAPPRERLIQIPIRIVDTLPDAGGNILGPPGYAQRTLEFLEGLNGQGDEVLLQWYAGIPEDRRAFSVIIEDVEYHQSSPPVGLRAYAGVALVTARTVA